MLTFGMTHYAQREISSGAGGEEKMSISIWDACRSAARDIFRRRSYARSAERLLNEMGNGNWSVSVTPKQILASMFISRAQDIFNL